MDGVLILSTRKRPLPSAEELAERKRKKLEVKCKRQSLVVGRVESQSYCSLTIWNAHGTEVIRPKEQFGNNFIFSGNNPTVSTKGIGKKFPVSRSKKESRRRLKTAFWSRTVINTNTVKPKVKLKGKNSKL